MEEPKVTVVLSTYNQEKYVRQALDSILMQKTSFPFEILAADDCSSDGTQQIITEYQGKYPNLIHTYFTPENIGDCKKFTNCIDKGLLHGEYLAHLEGDDYWLREDRLQILADFLDTHPEYSRVAHRRKVIDEKDREKGYDIPQEVLNCPFPIRDFLAGRNYSDFGSVFRNYFLEAGEKYHPLLLSSRNVCDFQDMFITQDFGPVYVMDRVFGVYRSRSVAGATNYNSITTQAARCKENVRLARAVEMFYGGRYDLGPMIRHNQKRLLALALQHGDREELKAVCQEIPAQTKSQLLAELSYLARRGHRRAELALIRSAVSPLGLLSLRLRELGYAIKRVWWKHTGKRPNELLRGYVREHTQP